MNFDIPGDLVVNTQTVSNNLVDGVSFTTVGNISGMSNTSNVTSGASIALFAGTTGERWVRTSRKVYFATISKIFFYVNEGGGGWGEQPDAGEGLSLQYSFNGTNWTNIFTIQPNDVTSNTWVLQEVDVPSAIQNYEGAYLRFKQDNSSGTAFDNWAISALAIQITSPNTGGIGGGGGGSGTLILDATNTSNVMGGTVYQRSLTDAFSDFGNTSSTPLPWIQSNDYVFQFGDSGNISGSTETRTITTRNKIFLASSELVEFWSLPGGVGGWGEMPDDLEEVILEYSYNGTTGWNEIGERGRFNSTAQNGLRWIRNVFKVPDGAKNSGGVFIRLKQIASGPSNDNYLVSSVYIRSYSSNTNSSFAALDFSNYASAYFHNAWPTTIALYNTIGGDDLPTSSTDGLINQYTPICIFDEGFPKSGAKRSVITPNRIYLKNSNTFSFHVCRNWYEGPDTGEELFLYYSLDGVLWTQFHKVLRVTSGAGTNESATASNAWTEVQAEIPDGAKVASGVYIKVEQAAFTDRDEWAITSIITDVGGGGGSSSGTGELNIENLPTTSIDTNDYSVGFTSVTSGITTILTTHSTKLFYKPSTGNLSSQSFTSLSDVRAKINIENINDPIGITQQLKGVAFNWKESKKPSLGLIAQDVEKVLPQIIETNSDGSKTVNYDAIIPILIESIKNHEIRIEKLEENS
jgi:hypothetical protein